MLCDKGGIMNRNLGSPVVSRGHSARGKPIPNPRPARRVSPPGGSETRGTPRVSPIEGNEVRRKGWQDGLASSYYR